MFGSSGRPVPAVEPPPVSASRWSTFGRPAAVVGLSRMVLLPAFSDTVNVLVDQVVQAPVPPNAAVETRVPLTRTSAGRPVAVPLAKRTPSVAAPAADAVTENWTAAPTALSPLQNPAPE